MRAFAFPVALLALTLSGCAAPSLQTDAAAASQGMSFVAATGVDDVFTMRVFVRQEISLSLGFTRSSAFIGFTASGPGQCAAIESDESGTWSCGVLDPGTYDLTLSVLAGVARGTVSTDPASLRPA